MAYRSSEQERVVPDYNTTNEPTLGRSISLDFWSPSHVSVGRPDVHEMLHLSEAS